MAVFKNPVDVMFDELEARDPDHFAVKQYRKYKLAAGKTAKSILISCGARLAPFDIAELRELMSYDEMELDTIGDRKTALFVIISDTDDTFNFVVAMVTTSLMMNRDASPMKAMSASQANAGTDSLTVSWTIFPTNTGSPAQGKTPSVTAPSPFSSLSRERSLM